jgi:hypothetical protein
MELNSRDSNADGRTRKCFYKAKLWFDFLFAKGEIVNRQERNKSSFSNSELFFLVASKGGKQIAATM